MTKVKNEHVSPMLRDESKASSRLRERKAQGGQDFFTRLSASSVMKGLTLVGLATSQAASARQMSTGRALLDSYGDYTPAATQTPVYTPAVTSAPYTPTPTETPVYTPAVTSAPYTPTPTETPVYTPPAPAYTPPAPGYDTPTVTPAPYYLALKPATPYYLPGTVESPPYPYIDNATLWTPDVQEQQPPEFSHQSYNYQPYSDVGTVIDTNWTMNGTTTGISTYQSDNAWCPTLYVDTTLGYWSIDAVHTQGQHHGVYLKSAPTTETGMWAGYENITLQDPSAEPYKLGTSDGTTAWIDTNIQEGTPSKCVSTVVLYPPNKSHDIYVNNVTYDQWHYDVITKPGLKSSVLLLNDF